MIQQFFDKQSFVCYTQPCDDAVRIEKLYFTVLIFFVCEILLVFISMLRYRKEILLIIDASGYCLPSFSLVLGLCQALIGGKMM